MKICSKTADIRHFFKLWDEGEAETVVVVTVERIVPVTVRNTTVLRIVVPRTTTQNTTTPLRFSTRKKIMSKPLRIRVLGKTKQGQYMALILSLIPHA